MQKKSGGFFVFIPLQLPRARHTVKGRRGLSGTPQGFSSRYRSRYCLAEFSQDTSLAMSRTTI